ncbi:E3 ubiquitin-protein ligase Zswim2 [Desmophyllum pertusum]|uniref:E3 ubiquitin-protein ligase Zswim2 n=1 Tax=Desmophyllum pertusum TaxID=174260 RepID=A0A9W9YY62_9CNID|nr:E3 ubiquitin-protein ligase Zswim2 [Desmophyllum pertusum]
MTPLPNAVISDLQNRDISDGDYDLLLQLDRQVTDEDGIPANIIHNLPTQVLQESHRLIIDGSNCGVCLQGFQTHQCIKTLPCQHPFHITCIDTWLTNHSQCPVDGSYIGSVSTAGSVATLQPNGHTVARSGTVHHCVK